MEVLPFRSEQFHFVFATVKGELKELTSNESIAQDGDRVMLVYPMRDDIKTGMVCMRLKEICKITGRLQYKSVCIYDPIADERFVTDFSHTP